MSVSVRSAPWFAAGANPGLSGFEITSAHGARCATTDRVSSSEALSTTTSWSRGSSSATRAGSVRRSAAALW